MFNKYIGGGAGLWYGWRVGQGKGKFCVVVPYLPKGDGVAGELNPRMSKDHVADFLGAGEHTLVLVDVRQAPDDQQWVVKPIRGAVRLHPSNDLQRLVADASLHVQRLGRSGLIAWLCLKDRKLGLVCYRVVAMLADEDSGKVVERTPEVIGRVPNSQRYGRVNSLENDSRPVRPVLIKVEFKFAADRWWVAVEIGSDTATEISYMLFGPIEFGVDVAELLPQWVTSSMARMALSPEFI